MAVAIRLQRVGKHKQPYYRLVAVDRRKAANKKPIEILGSYNPRSGKPSEKVVFDQARVDYWLGQGAQPSETVRTLLKGAASPDGGKVRTGYKKSKKTKARLEAEKKAKAEKKDEAKAEKKDEVKAEKKDEVKAEKKDEAKAEKKDEAKAEKKDEAKK